jgi:nitrite reductase (cytochrome c-552)
MKRYVLGYLAVFGAVAVAAAGVTALLVNIHHRKVEAKDTVLRIVDLTEATLDAKEWGKNFPRQYDGWLRTSDTNRTRYGGSEAFSHLEKTPALKRIFAGYAFGVDYREERGHMYSLTDQKLTERTHKFNQPGSCLHCHGGGMKQVYEAQGGGDLMAGFVKVCAMPLTQAWTLVSHPVTCTDCHDPATMALRVTRPGFTIGIAALAASEEPAPTMPSVERWRRDGRKGSYDPNAMATRQEMRSFVCGQCHVEYYCGPKETLFYPWSKGLKAEQIEACYDAHTFPDGGRFHDWKHAETGAEVVKAQHPEFELWNQGIHARSGVACADCHMPYKREGAMKITDHHIRSPMLNTARACQTCHHFDEAEMKARVEAVQDRTKALMDRASDAVVALIDDIVHAKQTGAPDGVLTAAREFQRKAQWRLDFINAENSMGFHAPQESARILAEAIDFARQGQLALVRRGVSAPAM